MAVETRTSQPITRSLHYEGPPTDKLPPYAGRGIRGALRRMMQVKDIRALISVEILSTAICSNGGFSDVYHVDPEGFRMASFMEEDQVVKVFVDGPVERQTRNEIGRILGFDPANAKPLVFSEKFGNQNILQEVYVPSFPEDLDLPSQVTKKARNKTVGQRLFGEPASDPYKLSGEEAKELYDAEIDGLGNQKRQEVIDSVNRERAKIEKVWEDFSRRRSEQTLSDNTTSDDNSAEEVSDPMSQEAREMVLR